ncbi:MAG: hypothetical protein ACLGGX_09355 [Bdellovibrionia bacterium]
MIKYNLKTIFLNGAFLVPTNSLENWKQLNFNKIPSNAVSISAEQTLKIEVKSSASPLVFKLPEVLSTKALEFSYDVKFSAKNQSNKQNTIKNELSNKKSFPEDFPLRVGLVARGEKKLKWFQKKIAA